MYKTERIGEIKDLLPFPKVLSKRCIGNIKNVNDILNKYDGIKHKEYEEFNQEIPELNIKLKDYQKRGISWLIDMEDNKNKHGIHGGLLCDQIDSDRMVQIIGLMLSDKR